MKKTFVCLANSKKYSGRCIAGIELARTEKGYKLVHTPTGLLRWVRPISGEEHGAIAEHIVENIALLDVVDLDVTSHVAQGYQSENHLFDPSSLRVASSIEATCKSLDHFLQGNLRMLFGNRGKAVSAEKVHELDRSLMFIKPMQVELYSEETPTGKDQVRATFLFANSPYDLPITDINFLAAYDQNPDLIKDYRQIYFTISLGLAYEGWHYKLVAGAIYF